VQIGWQYNGEIDQWLLAAGMALEFKRLYSR
jgi:hypothetical protein